MKKLILTGVLFCLVTMAGIAQRVVINPVTVPGQSITIKFDFQLNNPGPGPAYPYPNHVSTIPQRVNGKSFARPNHQRSTRTFIEFGDGTFSFDAAGNHVYSNDILNYSIVTKSSGIYDQGDRPPRHTLSDANNISSTTFTINNNGNHVARQEMPALLDPDKFIWITPSIASVVPNDTMIFVLTYKLPGTIAKSGVIPIIRFCYNNTGVNAFIPLSDPGTLLSDRGVKVPIVRTYNAEIVNSVGNAKKGFDQALEFAINNLDTSEHNIFITLVPDPKLSVKDLKEVNPVKIYAELAIKEKNEPEVKAPTPGMTDEVEMPAFALSHDPNYVIITPGCNAFPKAGKLLTFYIRCQNEGLGPATQVRMKVALPGGISAKDVENYNAYGSKSPYRAHIDWDFNTDTDSVTILFTPDTDGSTPNYILSNAVENRPDDPSTMASAWFTIPANESMHNLVMSTANIYFRNMAGAGGNWNPAVTTNPGMAWFSECCDCKKKKGCGCKKTKKKLWRWLFCKKC